MRNKRGVPGPASDQLAGRRRVLENRLMNRCFCVWVGSILATISLAGSFTRIASGQAAPAAPVVTIPPQALNATSETPYAADFKKFIDTELADLTGNDYAAQGTARDALKRALVRGSTPAYYSTFAKDWTTASQAIIARNPPLAVRLNIAIVTFTLADNGQTPDAIPLTVQLLNDHEPCVMLWGIKAARPLVILLATSPAVTKGLKQVPAVTASPLPAAIVNAVKRCGNSEVSGFATTDAYAALVVKEIPGLAPPQVQLLVPPLADPVLDIIEYRVSQHAEGVVQSPGAERDISTWLSGVYPSLQPTQKTRLVQLLVDLDTYAGKRADLYENDKKDFGALRTMLEYVSSALKVIGGPQVGNNLDWLTTIPPAATPAQIDQHTTAVYSIMVVPCPNIKAPPAIKTIAPPPPPAAPVAPTAAGVKPT